MTRPLRVVLGPQRHRPCVRAALESALGEVRGPVALITAGWEEREGEDDELREAGGQESLDAAFAAKTGYSTSTWTG